MFLCVTADNGIREAGARELALALKENTTLQSLNLLGECFFVFVGIVCVVFRILLIATGM